MAYDDREVLLLGPVRTPIGEFLGALSKFSATDLGGMVVAETVKRAGVDPSDVEEVIMGNVVSGGLGQAPARQAAIKGGIPPEAGALLINKVCGSGLKAVMLGAQAIKLADAEIIVAGGMESMSCAPYLLPKARTGFRMGDDKVVDSMILDGLWDAFNNYHMGIAAEYTAEKSSITREMQDEYAAESHRKAVEAQKNGKFKEEMMPVEVPQRKGDPVLVEKDDRPREGTTAEGLARMRPAFKKDGTVTAGNAPGINDGAAAVVVASDKAVNEKGLKPMAKVTAYATAGVDPKELFYAPVFAVRKVLDKLGVDIDYFDLIEANEAFSAQALADGKELEWDWDKVNVHGGAVALGHPIGASGARVLATLLYAMKDRGAKTGLATLCLGGGHAVALSVEAV
jgi:acetyl-CoA C-acetyltransferase